MNPEPARLAPVPLARAALGCRCPRCGEGRLFDGLLSVRSACQSCGLDFSGQDAADGPAVFVIFFLGLIVVGLAAYVELRFSPPIRVHFVLWTPLIIGGASAMLRPLKAGLIALQYRHHLLQSPPNGMIRGMRGGGPGLAPTLITFPIVLLCLGLGVWQIQRLHWKEGLIAQREATLAAPPITLPHALAAAQALEWRRVVTSGTFLNDKESRVHTIAPQGEAGFDILTPLREASGDVVFVDRGFVPTALADPARRPAGEPTGDVQVSGRLRLAPSSKPGWFLPDNRPNENEWFWADLPAMAKTDGLSDVAPFYVAADATPNPGGWPKGGATLPELPNNHLQYAVTWFSLAVAALVIYVLSQRRGADNKDERISRT